MPTIAANLIIENGKLLMLYRKDKDYWELPAGKIEDGEAAEEAARREAQEEVGITIEIEKEWYEFRVQMQHEGRHFYTKGFISEITEGEPTAEEEVFGEIDWKAPEEIREINLAPNLEMIQEELTQLLQNQ